MIDLKILTGAKISFIKLSYQVEFSLVGGVNRKNKYANLQIEDSFRFETKSGTSIITPGETNSLAPVVSILHCKLIDIEVGNQNELTLKFDNGNKIQVIPNHKYESWNITGDDLASYIAT